jgi:hypothetical protein
VKQAASGRREVFRARPWECLQHSARRRVSVRHPGAAEIFPEGRKAVAREQVVLAPVPRQDAFRKAALQRVSVDRVPGDRPGVQEIFEVFRAQPLDERHWEQQRQGGAPRAEQERRREVSGA